MKTIHATLTVFLLAVAIMLFTCGCAISNFGVSTEPDSLKVLTPEDIESIFAEISYETTEKYPTETNESGNVVVFWLEGGSVWHLSRSCSTVKKADSSKVKSGSVQDALNDGKERACKICGTNSNYTGIVGTSTEIDTEELNIESESVTEKYQKEYTDDGELIVFWLESGKVWHESRSCSSLSRSNPDKLIQGSAAEAVAAGKERVCKNCSE